MEVNLWAVLVAAVVKFAIGGVWYTALFGRRWRALMGVPEGTPPTGLGQAMVVQIIGDLIMAYVLARFILHYGGGLGIGVLVGLMAWLGFVATVSVGQIFYEKRPPAVFAINNGYLIVGLAVMGAIIGWWQGGVIVPTPA